MSKFSSRTLSPHSYEIIIKCSLNMKITLLLMRHYIDLGYAGSVERCEK